MQRQAQALPQADSTRVDLSPDICRRRSPLAQVQDANLAAPPHRDEMERNSSGDGTKFGSDEEEEQHSSELSLSPAASLETAISSSVASHASSMPAAPRIDAIQDSTTCMSSISDLPSLRRISDYPASGETTPTQQSMRAVEEAALAFARTRRFEWTAVEKHGNLLGYVVTGHADELTSCASEAIHAPGAIQSFGVLIAFDQEPNGRLVVQQVSENAGSLLNLDPHALLSANSLSSFLPEASIMKILEHLDIFDDYAHTSCECSPLTFVLDGYDFQAHAAIHRPSLVTQPKRVILDLELVNDSRTPCTPPQEQAPAVDESGNEYRLPPEMNELDTWRRRRARGQEHELDCFNIISALQRQFSAHDHLETFLRLITQVFCDLTEFARGLVYKFDENDDGKVIEEVVDVKFVRDCYNGLVWPASDIPPQARALYQINTVRLLYDRDQPTARMCCRSLNEVNNPLDMTLSYLRAMSPIHMQYLRNMDVKSSMSISLIVDGKLWGLIALHAFGDHGRRVCPPLRRLCRLVGELASTHLERILLKERVDFKKIISDSAGTGASPDLLLDVFEADWAVLIVGGDTKLVGPIEDSREIFAIVAYLREQNVSGTLHTHEIRKDFPNIPFEPGFELIAGFLAVPLCHDGSSYIVFFRRSEERETFWAGDPRSKDSSEEGGHLQPRASFKVWREQVVGQSRRWTEQQIEACSLLSLVYGQVASILSQAGSK